MDIVIAADHPEIVKLIEKLETPKGISELEVSLKEPGLSKWAKPLTIVGQPLYRERVIEIAKAAQPDIILLHDKLPGSTIELDILLEEIKLEVQNKEGKDTRVVLLTSLEQGSPLLRKAVDLGVYDIISGRDIEAIEIVRRLYEPNTFKAVAHFRLAPDNRDHVTFVPKYIDREVEKIKEVTVIQEKVITQEVQVVQRVGNLKGMKETILLWSPFETGKTTVAVNLAVAMAKMGLRTVLLDADVENRTLEYYFKLTAEEKYALIVGINTRMEATEILKRCHTYKDNLKVLAFPSGATEKPSLTQEDFLSIYDGIRRHCDVFIIDGSKDLESPFTKAAMKTASRVVVVSTLDLVKAMKTRIILNGITPDFASLDKFEAIINFSVKTGVTRQDIQDILQLEVIPYEIPATLEAMYISTCEGTPAYYVKKVPEMFTYQINALANYFNEGDPKARKLITAKKTGFGFFSKLKGE